MERIDLSNISFLPGKSPTAIKLHVFLNCLTALISISGISASAYNIDIRPRAYELPENIPSCSIKRSRIARTIIINEIEVVLSKFTSAIGKNDDLIGAQPYKIGISGTCIFNLTNSMYEKLEKNTKEYAQRFWKDKESGKLFRNENYLDLYLYKKYFVNNNQSSNQLYNAGRQPTCLSNFCDKVLNGCYDLDDLAKSLGVEVYTDELRDINHPNFHRAKTLYLSQNKVSCTKKSVELRHHYCLKSFHSCFSVVPSGAEGIDYSSQDLRISRKEKRQQLIKLLNYFDKTFCSYDICKYGPRNMVQDIGTYGAHSPLNNPRTYYAFFSGTFVGTSIMCIVLAFLSFACYTYYAEQQGKVIHDDLRRIRKKWTVLGKDD